MNNWISVNDALPELTVCVDLYVDWQDYTGRVCNCFRNNDGDYWMWDDSVRFKININASLVTHWMPLPEPPKDN
jgi:hypothetical protein